MAERVVFLGRFVGILRTYTALLAGANHMGFRRFFVFNATGGVTWAATYGFGYYFPADLIDSLGTAFGVAVTLIAMAGVIVSLVVIRRNIASWEGRAEQALPGPLSPPPSGPNLPTSGFHMSARRRPRDARTRRRGRPRTQARGGRSQRD